MTYMPTGPGSDGPRPAGPSARPDTGTGASRPGADARNPLARTLSLVTAGLGVLILLLGFTSVVKSTGYRGSTANFFETGNAAPLALLLIAGLIAGVGLLPEQSKLTGAAAAVAVGGFLCLVLQTIAFAISDGAGPAWGSYLELFLGLVLTAAAVGAMLIDAGIISPSASNSAPPRGFGQYGQMGAGQSGAGQSGAGQSGAGQSGAAPHGQRTSSSYGPPAPSQYGQSQGQFGAPQGSPDQSGGYGQGAPSTQSQPGSGYYGAADPQQSYGQQPQQPSYGQAPSYGQPQPYGQQPQGQSYGQQPQEQSYGQQPREQSYGQQPQGQSYGQPQEEQSYGQSSEEQSHGQQPSPEQGESAGSYSPPTQAFGSHAVEDETTVHPRENPYGPPHQQ